MTKGKGEGRAEVIDLKGLLARDEDFERAAVGALVRAALEAEMTEAIGAEKGARSETRLAYRSGYCSRSPITWVGTLELRVPQDRMGRFSTDCSGVINAREKALVGTLAETYVQGVSTRKSLPSRRRGSTTTACASGAGLEPVLGPAKPDPGDRRDLAEVQRDIAQWQAKHPRLCNWVEDNIEETLSYYRLPLPHHKHMKSTNMRERLNQELKRRTHVVRIFPNTASCLRLVRAAERRRRWCIATRRGAAASGSSSAATAPSPASAPASARICSPPPSATLLASPPPWPASASHCAAKPKSASRSAPCSTSPRWPSTSPSRA